MTFHSAMKLCTSTIGFPRIGAKREMKKALESYWSGGITGEEMVAVANQVEIASWQEQADAGIDLVALDGTMYDHVLDFAVTYLGLVPERFSHLKGLDQYFACARGSKNSEALDMSKYFDTNYHYIAPEITNDMKPCSNWQPFLEKVKRGQDAIGVDKAVPLVLGPVTLAYLCRQASSSIESLVTELTPHYEALLTSLADLDVPEVQIHEPCLTISKADDLLPTTITAYEKLSNNGVSVHLVVPYDDVSEAVYCCLIQLPVYAIGFDFCGVPGASYGNSMCDLIACHGFPKSKRLGVGVIDGRSIWKDSGEAMAILRFLRKVLGRDQEISIQTSTSLQHVPFDARLESDNTVSDLLGDKISFAIQKLGELSALAVEFFEDTGDSIVRNPAREKAQEAKFENELVTRSETYHQRRKKQYQYPPFPTTSIGSFPQTPYIRKIRLQYKKAQVSEVQYREAIAAEIGFCIGVQEAIGMDVLVHGEAERTDMVEYFGLRLDGFAFTDHGWVQSYGSRYVRPPIIYGDVSRKGPMTVHEFELAQKLTEKPVKGMLTGPVTILNWSFPRKDISRSEQARQIALAIREEVDDLQEKKCLICQVDEPALREGLPLKQSRVPAYLDWATKAFRLATAVARPEVQIVTHLCYSEFEDILDAIDALDADVLTIENSRSSNEMIYHLASFPYKRDVGPGVFDVHSPNVPSVEAMLYKIESFSQTNILQGDACRIHVNPDCGLKTRKWREVLPALKRMVNAAKEARKRSQQI